MHLRLDGVEDEKPLVESLIKAATDHLDGWTGILGACIALQEWRQDFDGFACCLPLPLGPVTEIKFVTWRTPDGTLSTISSNDYSLVTDAGGRSFVRFKDDYQFPTDTLHESRAVAVTYEAGHDPVPDAIKSAILLLVGHWFAHREAVVVGTITAELPLAVDRLLAPYRHMKI